jgi:hypothetical protein
MELVRNENFHYLKKFKNKNNIGTKTDFFGLSMDMLLGYIVVVD